MANETISGCRSVALHCVLNRTKVCEKRMKRSSALSTLQTVFFEKVLCVFRFVTSILSLERITLKLLTNKYSFISS